MVRLALHKLFLMLLLRLNFWPQPLQTNTWPLCCQNLCWLGVGKERKALSQTLQVLTLSLSLVLCPSTLNPYSNSMNFPHKPALDTCRFRCQQMSTPLHVLLKADPHLVGDVLQYLQMTASSMDHQHVFRSLTFLRSSCHTRLHCSGIQGRLASRRLPGA